jgi:hypothetical protein
MDIEELKLNIQKFEKNEISEEEFRLYFYHNYRDFLPEEVYVPTSWHIDDLRDYFSEENMPTDEQLCNILSNLATYLDNSAVDYGYEAIAFNIKEAAESEGICLPSNEEEE